MFNLVRNRMAALPGATGLNRDLKPAESYGHDHYTGQMLKIWDRLDERHRRLIRFPMMTAEEFGEVAGRSIMRSIPEPNTGWKVGKSVDTSPRSSDSLRTSARPGCPARK